jgi:hypothetical protein
MVNCRNVLIALLVIIVVAMIMTGSYGKKVEKYANVYYNKELDPTMLSRSTFNSNLDPRNMNVRSDPYAYGGYLKGGSPDQEKLASYNKVSSYQDERKFNSPDTASAVGKYTGPGKMNDAVSYIDYKDENYDSTVGHETGENMSSYEVIDDDFANLGSDGTFQSAKMKASTKKYKDSLSNTSPDTLKYTLPEELLPAPDMRQPLMRDPSDPSNFMYDRTLFAPLKKRNHNEADRIRGDLDIEPVKTGWFDVATVPTVDLVKGYFGYYNDISEYQDLQDIAYTRQRDEMTGSDSSVSTKRLTATANAARNDLMKPSLKYATAPTLDFGPLNKSYKQDNPWYNSLTGRSKLEYQL